jgi:hypothetical protein
MSTETRTRITPAVQELRDEMSGLRKGLFEAIEAVGFQSLKQENALKGLIRQLTYQAQGHIEAAMRREEE